MITGRGIVYLLLLVLLYLGLAYSGISQLIPILLTLIFLPVLSMIQLLILKRHINIRSDIGRPMIQRQEETDLQIHLELTGRQMIGLLEVSVRKPGVKSKPAVENRQMAIMPQSAGELSVQLQGRHRGSFRVGPTRVVCRDLFGLFRLPLYSRRFMMKKLLTFTVLPNPYAFDPLANLSAALNRQAQQHAWQIGSDLDTIANIRSQQPGDSLKRAHWKLSARLNEIMIKEFENPQQLESLLLADWEHAAGTVDSWLEYSDFFTDCTAYLARQILTAGSGVRIVAYQEHGRSEVLAGKIAEMQNIQLFLAALQTTQSWPPDKILAEEADRFRSAQLLVSVTNRLSLSVVHQLMNLRHLKREVWLVLISPGAFKNPLWLEWLEQLAAAGVTVYTADFASIPAIPAKNRKAGEAS
ncbi:MAG: DUF58 domain-containing protein [Clostridiaceae bacterium]|nr:DUF58 domain-containing protein [Clostridiaceae bacterium]